MITHEEEVLLQRHYDHLNDQQKCNINRLDVEARIMYEKMLLLASKKDYRPKMAKARHTLSPMDDLKSKLMRVPNLITGLENLGPIIAEEMSLAEHYEVSKRAYESIETLDWDRMKMLKTSEPVLWYNWGMEDES